MNMFFILVTNKLVVSGAPFIGSNNASLSYENFGGKYVMYFIISVGTAIGENGKHVILVSGFAQGG